MFLLVNMDTSLTFTGDVEKAYDTIIKLQDALEQNKDIINKTSYNEISNSLSNWANLLNKTISNNSEFYNEMILQERIMGNDKYKESFNKIRDAYNEWHEAYINGDEDAANVAFENYAQCLIAGDLLR